MIKTWINYQREKSKELIYEDIIEYNKIKLVGGLDISFNKIHKDKACVYLTVFDISKKEIVYENYELVDMKVPYISGFLGFREVPAFMLLINKVKSTEFKPDVILVDGFGVYHHNGFGSASHLSYECNIPSIGIGKNLLCFDGISEFKIKKEFKKKCLNKGDFIYIKGLSGKVYGAALKSSDSSTNPIFISVGNQISLESAIKLATEVSIYRIPEPIRNSDIKSKLYL